MIEKYRRDLPLVLTCAPGTWAGFSTINVHNLTSKRYVLNADGSPGALLSTHSQTLDADVGFR